MVEIGMNSLDDRAVLLFRNGSEKTGTAMLTDDPKYVVLHACFWYKENAENMLMLRSYYKAGRWDVLKRMANSHLSLLSI